MRTISASEITAQTAQMIRAALITVEPNTARAIEDLAHTETAPLCKWALKELVKNNNFAKNNKTFPCQDCGQAVLFVKMGQEVYVDGDLTNALDKAVELGFRDARKSVCDPLTRINTNTNTPAVTHYEIVPGDTLEISFLAKGAGAENMSQIFMLHPGAGEKGIIQSVVKTVKSAGANPCPPVVIGVGIGGTMETAALLSKKALLKQTGAVSELEQKILTAVNKLKIGAQGFGGDVTALGAAVETAPTHIGMLPVAVNLQCHCVRHGSIKL